MALIGTISGSNGTSTTAISGSIIIADRPPGEFPSLPPNAKFYVSGTRDVNGPLGAIGIFGGDVFVTGGLGVSDYVQMLPVNELRIPTNTTASYIYTSGSTNDMYFTQYSGPYTNTTRLRWLESSLSTGLLHGGILSTQNGTTTFSITSGSGIIVYQNASITSDPYPTIKFVKWPTYISQSLQYSGSAQITYIAIDQDGEIDQSPIAFNDAQFKDRIVLGRVLHQSGSVTNGSTNTPTTAYAVSQNTNDFVRAFGPLKISGHYLAASGSAPTLSLTKTAGLSYVEGRNYANDPNNPNIITAGTDTEVTISKIYREYVSGSTPVIDTGVGNAGYTILDPGQYNNNGTLAAVDNGEYTIQRVFWFPRAVNRAFFVYYGTAKYTTMDDAVAGIGTENFIEGDNTAGSAILVGYVCLKGNALDLLNPLDAKIYQGGLFRGSSGASFGGAGGGTSPGGLDTYVQFNDDNAFGGDSGFTFNKTTHSITLTGDVNAVNASLSGQVSAPIASISGNIYASGTLYAKDVSIYGNLTVTSGSTIISGSGAVSIQTDGSPINIGTTAINVPSGSQTVTIPFASNNTFTSGSGVLQSHNFPSPYLNNADGYTVFSGIPGVYRTITGIINTEASFDSIRVYDGAGTGGTLLYQRSGLATSFSFTSSENQTFTVRFTSDSLTTNVGFSLTVTGQEAQRITIGSTGQKIINIGNTSNTFPLILSGGTGGVVITTDAVNGNIELTNTSTGSLNLFNDSGAGTINIAGPSATGTRSINVGTGGTAAKTVTIGNSTVAGSATNIVGGTTGGINIASTSGAPINIAAGSVSAGTVSIGTGAANQTLSFGTGAGVKLVSVGSINTSSRTNISGGTGGINITTDGVAGSISIINTSTGNLNLFNDTGTGQVSIVGSSATGARTVDIGTGGTGTKILRIGNDTVAASTTTLFAGTSGGVNIATSAVATPVNIATNTTAGTVNIGTGTATQTLNFGTGAGAKTVTIGSRNTTSTTLINAGAGGVTISSGTITANSIGSDVFFYVSGNIASKPAASPDYTKEGTTVFGGDVVISGTLFGGSPLYLANELVVSSNQISGSNGGNILLRSDGDVAVLGSLWAGSSLTIGNIYGSFYSDTDWFLVGASSTSLEIALHNTSALRYQLPSTWKSFKYTLDVMGRRSSDGQYWWGEIRGGYKKVGVTISQIGGALKIVDYDTGLSGADVNLTVSGNSIIITASGLDGTYHEWWVTGKFVIFK